jgi:hypothetical protein
VVAFVWSIGSRRTGTSDQTKGVAGAQALPAERGAQAGRGAQGAQDDAAAFEAILSRHELAVGCGSAGTPGGGLEFSGRLESGGSGFTWRALVRLEPFGWREEITLLAPGSKTSAGATDVVASNGRRIWRLHEGGSAPLEGLQAITALDNVCLFRFLLQPRVIATRGGTRPAIDVPCAQGWPADPCRGRRADVLHLEWPHGRTWSAYFEERTGKLLGMDDSAVPHQHWVRFDGWRQFGGSDEAPGVRPDEAPGAARPRDAPGGSSTIVPPLTLPTILHHGGALQAFTTLTIEDVRAGVAHPDELFEGDPLPPRPRVAEASPLRVAPIAVPGSAHLVLPAAYVQGSGPFPALLDGGARWVFVDRDLADRLQLGTIGAVASEGAFGGDIVTVRWIDELVIGRERLLQVPARAGILPRLPQLPSDGRPLLIWGASELHEAAPIVDLSAGALRLRGRPVTPLAELAGRSALTIPLLPLASGRYAIDVDVRGARLSLTLDSGLPHLLRLSPDDMRLAGIPAELGYWRDHGAIPYPIGGAHGQGGVDLLVRLDEVRVGPVVFERPWVLLGGLDGRAGGPGRTGGGQDDGEAGGDDAGWSGYVGTGLFLPFEQVGIDSDRHLLELLPAAAAPAGTGAAPFVVPPPGEFLGFFLDPPPVGATAPPAAFPRMSVVIERTNAAAAGLRIGDQLMAIDGVSAAGAAPWTLWTRLWPPEGTSVELSVLKGGTTPVTVRLP